MLLCDITCEIFIGFKPCKKSVHANFRPTIIILHLNINPYDARYITHDTLLIYFKFHAFVFVYMEEQNIMRVLPAPPIAVYDNLSPPADSSEMAAKISYEAPPYPVSMPAVDEPARPNWQGAQIKDKSVWFKCGCGPFRVKVNPIVTIFSVLIIAAFILWCVLEQESKSFNSRIYFMGNHDNKYLIMASESKRRELNHSVRLILKIKFLIEIKSLLHNLQ